MKLLFAGHFTFPSGGASASRVRHLSLGLAELGHRVSVLALGPRRGPAPRGCGTEWQELGPVAYRNLGGGIPAGRGRLVRADLYWRAARNATAQAIQAVERLHGQDPLDAIVVYSKSHWFSVPILRFARSHGIAVIRDVVEWTGPDSYTGGWINPLYWDSLLSFHGDLPRAGGIIAITSYLAAHFRARGLPVLRIPAIIDTDKPAPPADPHASSSGSLQFTYLGGLTWRDGPTLMVKAVQRLLRKGHDVFFNVVGSDGSQGPAAAAFRYAEADADLRGHVRFWGRVSDEQVVERLACSDALIFTRLSGRAARASFPTRLPEYLMSGRPVVASDVSDIGEFLHDGEHIVLVKPDSDESLAGGLLRLMALPDRGRSIGLAGREQCRKCFDFRSRCAEVSEFIADIAAGRNGPSPGGQDRITS